MRRDSDEYQLEGRAEIYLTWAVLLRIAGMMVIPLVVSLLFDPIWIKIICWLVFFSMLMSNVPVWGSCIYAIAIGVLPTYVFFEWDSAPDWLAYIAGFILFIEIIYINRRIKIIEEFRKNIE